ncbi:PrgI family mobile element protein [Metabacillus fastidiosus]|uniref:PrgI family protein n=1 Tax=Metabacillus fastidiosus TaxID=1458 RepID=A0ABU6P1U3_9BACI|nr:PrgI family protein [Metabacillus fastidiosus]MED4402116.1 PrgI family protein [Metabacillus fastidiosus]
MDIIVPVDLTEEEKEVLAIFSKRQFMIVFPTMGISLGVLIFGNIPFIAGIADVGIRFFFSIFAIGTAIAMAFVHLDKYEQYLSEFIVTKIKYHLSQKKYHP